jgi:hypothetical protein
VRKKTEDGSQKTEVGSRKTEAKKRLNTTIETIPFFGWVQPTEEGTSNKK